MTKKYKFLWTSLVFVVIEVFFMFVRSNQTFSWLKLLVGYAIFALLYSILSKISVSDHS